jgi:hypothetical protein
MSLSSMKRSEYRVLSVDAPDGTLRKDGLKVVEGGKIRYGKKK